MIDLCVFAQAIYEKSPTMEMLIDAHAELKGGWYNGEGEPISLAAQATAHRLAQAIQAERFGRPEIFPEVSGGYQFEWILLQGEGLLIDVIAQIKSDGSVWWFGDASRAQVDIDVPAERATAENLAVVMARIGFARLY
jgi:hypothetical protein